MWRRNGFSLVNQIYFYRNVKCRSEMLDRDIIILQIGASLIENNEFLIHVLNKFHLVQWADNMAAEVNTLESDEEDSTSQVINMVDELLELLIMIVGERFVCGIGEITEEDRIKKEIIQKLCIKPYSHSELNRALNEDLNSETGMENVIQDVAVFKKSADKKGVYELKPEYFDNYNMYFYHYSREEKSKSEEVQRSRRKAKGELICCPPPKLPKLTETFRYYFPYNEFLEFFFC
jgi:E3 ubiquitin-protein ligase UBR2